MSGLLVDLFAGGGGASVGIEAVFGRNVDIAINHDPVAIAVHTQNHPLTRHYTTDVWDVRPLDATKGHHVRLLHASPDCKHFSRAKGGKPISRKIRSLAWVVRRWAREVRPDVITLENVPEFLTWGPLDADDKPIESRKGETFRRWKRDLERLGYVIEHRVLQACDFGAPTSRKRLFFVARCDGQPICWPEPTHGPGLLPYRTAAECIDWSIPCPSIFERERPLAEKTLKRIAAGLRRFVVEHPSPFIVPVNHGGGENRAESLRAPLSTVTAARRGHALVAPMLVQTGYGERKGQRPRYLDIHQPLGTAMAQGQKHALVSAFLAKHYGDNGQRPGSDLSEPIATVTAVDHHSIVTAHLEVMRQHAEGKPVDGPVPTITASGTHTAEVRAFLTTYYGSTADVGQHLNDPLRTGLVTVKGTLCEIADIGMRMLEPHELLRAQFGAFADGYDLSPAVTKKDRVHLIGNSVCPEVERALIAANFPEELEQRKAA